MTKKEALEQGYTKITLKITKKDLKESSFLYSEDCPITRALKRAGYKDMVDVGNSLWQKGKGVVPTLLYYGIFSRVVREANASEPKGFQWTFCTKI